MRHCSIASLVAGFKPVIDRCMNLRSISLEQKNNDKRTRIEIDVIARRVQRSTRIRITRNEVLLYTALNPFWECGENFESTLGPSTRPRLSTLQSFTGTRAYGARGDKLPKIWTPLL